MRGTEPGEAADTLKRVRVLVYASAPDDDPGAVEAAYHTVSRALEGTPGLLGNTLLRSVLDPGKFVVMSEWTDLAAFQAWEGRPEHRNATAPLRPLQHAEAGATYGIYEVTAAY